MKSSTKIISLVLLISFFGLLSLGVITDKPASSTQHSGGVNCFGAGCGPVEHVVMHEYLIAGVYDGKVNIERYQQTLIDYEIIPQNNFIIPDTPPPILHLFHI